MYLPMGFFGTLSPIHWLIVAVVILLLFGNRLPSVMRSLGRGVVEFKKGLEGEPEDEEDGARKERLTSADKQEGESKPSQQTSEKT